MSSNLAALTIMADSVVLGTSATTPIVHADAFSGATSDTITANANIIVQGYVAGLGSNASTLATGTLANALLPATLGTATTTLFVGNGAQLSNLSASNVTSGTVSAALLPTPISVISVIASTVTAPGGVPVGPGGNASITTNTAIGQAAMSALNVTGTQNTACGVSALQNLSTQSGMTAVGYQALKNTTGSQNTAVGYLSCVQLTTGANATACGHTTMYGITTGTDNCALGTAALAFPSAGTASRNCCVGVQAGQYLLGTDNVAVGGGGCLQQATSCNRCTALGQAAITTNTNPSDSVGVGYLCAYLSGSGQYNCAIGSFALSNAQGNLHVAAGYNAMPNLVSGNCNTSCGYSTLNNDPITSNVITSMSNSAAFGYTASCTASNQMQLGGATNLSVYAYNSSVQVRSDARDKADVRDTALGLEWLKKLRAVDYRWDWRDAYVDVADDGTVAARDKDGSRTRHRFHTGFIAQDIEALIQSTGLDFGGLQHHSVNGGSDVYTLAYGELVAVLVKGIQEVSERIAALETK